jgi:hypothetical protein
MKNEITGGVSPLKKKLLIKGGKQYRGGTKSKSRGTKGKRSGGFGQSTSRVNPQAYTKNTRFRIPDKKTFPSSGGGDNTTNPPPQKPFGWTPMGDFNFDFSDLVNVKINNANQQAGGGLEEKTETTKETTEEPGKTGNEFYDNCHDKDGNRLEGHIFYSEIKKMRILCKWGGKSDGSFNYKKKGSSTTKTTTTTSRKRTGGGKNVLTQTNK